MINNKLSIYYWFGYDLPSEELFRMIRQAGFLGTSIWWTDEYYADYRFHPGIARKAGLAVENIHAPFLPCNSLWIDNAEGKEHEEHLLRCVADCAEYEIPAMVVHLSGGANTPAFNELGLNRIKRIVDRAERCGINIAIENMRKREYLDYVIGNINSERLGFCYDSGHHNCWTPEDKDLISRHGSRLKALHLHDNKGDDDKHLLPFDGTIDWSAVMKEIAATGYKGSVSLEAMALNRGYENMSPEEFLRMAYERANKLLALLK